MVSFIVQVLVTALGLWLSDYLLAGITFTDTVTLLLASVILGVVNAFVRPVLVILTFPITVITLGLFLLVINAAMIGLTSLFLGGFVLAGLWPAIGAAIITGVVSWIASMVVRD